MNHATSLSNIMIKSHPGIYDSLISKGVEIDIVIVEWVFSLFSSVIPIEVQIRFYFGFFAEGWNFFYKMCISVILTLEKDINEGIEADEIYLRLKFGKHEDNYENNSKRMWNSIIDNSFLIEN